MNISDDIVDEADGASASVKKCECRSCQNVFWVLAPTAREPWQPTCCPFCLRRFAFAFIDEEPATFIPKVTP
jgi:hypothetical protein